MASQPRPAHQQHSAHKQVKTHEQVGKVVRFKPGEIRRRVAEVQGFDAKMAVIITSGVGTMVCAYAFAILALVSLPDAIEAGRPELVDWISGTFIQFVLLSIILVGQRVQSATSDARAQKQYEDTELILDKLNTETAGGIAEILAAVRALEAKQG